MNEQAVNAAERVPPHNLDAEQSALGSMMIERSALDTGLYILHPIDFYRPAHQEIFRALKALSERGEPADLITLTEELRGRGKLDTVGGTEYLMSLVESVPTAANIEYYARIVERHSLLRAMVHVGNKITQWAYEGTASDDEVEAIISKAEQSVFKLGDRRSRIDIISLADAYHEFYSKLEQPAVEGVPIGLKALADELIDFQPGDLIVVGAATAVGKTALVYDLLKYAAAHGYPAGYISCEMTDEQIVAREIAKEAEVSVKRMRLRALEQHHWDDIAAAMDRDAALPISFVDAASGWTMTQIHTACRRMAANGVKVIAIDHIQAVEPTNPRADRRNQVAQIARDCKRLAADLKIPVLAPCQLSRSKKGSNPKPTKSDLKESGDIENYADVVLLLWRKESNEDRRSRGVSDAEIIIAKNRMLEGATVKCGFHGRKFKFVEMDWQYGQTQMEAER